MQVQVTNAYEQDAKARVFEGTVGEVEAELRAAYDCLEGVPFGNIHQILATLERTNFVAVTGAPPKLPMAEDDSIRVPEPMPPDDPWRREVDQEGASARDFASPEVPYEQRLGAPNALYADDSAEDA